VAADRHAGVPQQDDRLIGIACTEEVVDGCITKAPGGGEQAGRSPVDRGKPGLQRSLLTDARGVPLHLVATGATRHDASLLEPTVAGVALPAGITVHRDRDDDSAITRTLLAHLRAKLGAPSRTAAAAHAVRYGLV
jgi:hypothetical protein